MSEPDSIATALPEYDFETLCAPHYNDLVRYAGRFFPGRQQEARDLVQEAFLKAYRYWHSWKPHNEDPSGSARGWLYRIVQNLFLDDVRAHNGHRKALDEHHYVVIENTYGVDDDYHVDVLGDGIGDEVRAALETLEPVQRDIVIRADFQGEQYLEIADALDIPLGTVMSRLHRGRKRLASALRSYAKNEYGICESEIGVKRPRLAEGTRTTIKPAPEDDLDSAETATLTFESIETLESDADGI